MKDSKALRLAVLFSLSSFACGDNSTEPQVAPSRIAFERSMQGVDPADIYLMNPDGSHVVNLTNHPADDRMPAWSPDATMISFWSDRDGRPGHDGFHRVHHDRPGQPGEQPSGQRAPRECR